MERYETYHPVEYMPESFSSASITDGDNGVVLKLRPPFSNQVLLLEFGRIPALRRILEECSFSSFDGNWDEPDKPVPCFIVHNSKWVSQFDKAELIHYPNPVHYAFLTDDQFIEVLSCNPPIAKWENVG